jgi:heme-degrading monooxygenase HmoA
MESGYLYIWEYLVPSDKTSMFESFYGPAGDWVQLFRRAPGYIRTELHRDRSNPQRFLTIDYWESYDAWQAFRRQFAKEFEALDVKGEELTSREIQIGRFEPVE